MNFSSVLPFMAAVGIKVDFSIFSCLGASLGVALEDGDLLVATSSTTNNDFRFLMNLLMTTFFLNGKATEIIDNGQWGSDGSVTLF